MSALDVTEVGKTYLRNIYSTHAYANSIVVSVLTAGGNPCYMLHEIEWCNSGKVLFKVCSKNYLYMMENSIDYV